VAPLLAALRSAGDYRILVCPDHPTPLRTKTHSHGLVPFALAGPSVVADESASYDEINAGRSRLSFEDGWKLMRYFLHG
jgi:2,3-bisphosphoglycerate-independent phosphoglycerate mutase